MFHKLSLGSESFLLRKHVIHLNLTTISAKRKGPHTYEHMPKWGHSLYRLTKMAQQAKALAVKSQNPSSISRAHTVKREK